MTTKEIIFLCLGGGLGFAWIICGGIILFEYDNPRVLAGLLITIGIGMFFIKIP